MPHIISSDILGITLNVQETHCSTNHLRAVIIPPSSVLDAPTRVMQVVARSAQSAVAASGRYTARVLDLHLQHVLVSTAWTDFK